MPKDGLLVLEGLLGPLGGWLEVEGAAEVPASRVPCPMERLRDGCRHIVTSLRGLCAVSGRDGLGPRGVGPKTGGGGGERGRVLVGPFP